MFSGLDTRFPRALAGFRPSCGRLLGSDRTLPDRFGPGVARPEVIMLDAPGKNGQRHILCINNDSAVPALFRDLLQEEGYRVSTRAYVDHDLKTINDLAPDLIVLDDMWSTEDAS